MAKNQKQKTPKVGLDMRKDNTCLLLVVVPIGAFPIKIRVEAPQNAENRPTI